MTNCPDKAHDEHRQRCIDEGICHICEGEGCSLCYAELKTAIAALECDAEWCGKSPRGTPGRRGYDDGKCQVCKIKALA